MPQALLCQSLEMMSIRFIPPPSAMSIGAYVPAKMVAPIELRTAHGHTHTAREYTDRRGKHDAACAGQAAQDARAYLTRLICSVSANSGVEDSLAIWLPVKRSYAREPVAAATASGPPSDASSAAHWSEVLLSIQTGEFGMEKDSASWSFSELPGERPASVSDAPVFQYTLPCCWPEPDTAAICEKSTLPLSLPSTVSRASIHSSVGEVTVPSSCLWTPPDVA
jgi:hypothetical protein